ncbi:hypothetical protein M8C21_007864 [Ambrosia artemisiifolia]|uniref:RPW8 domain-containing protein n=1 Tax=Ambrosia artemisiifolia TaxID=4212 RepID=A0AAD5CPX3_AMBAR|nr:hypothetical protein M8C21_007864 [Ambrosia artemisiifolia]
MPGDVDWNLDEIHLEDYGLPDLPNSPTCPNLVKLFLQVPSLAVIPPDFFKHMRGLKVLDLSNTNIVSLPTSISSLPLLQEFFLRDCSALIELPSEIGMLSELKVFDIKGTELMFLPKGMGNLKNLEVLRISLSQYAQEYIKNSVNETVIPRMMISGLRKLKELCVLISVGPEPEWWEEEVKYLNNELCDLTNLETLGWYLPTTEVLQQFLLLERNHVPIYASLSNLMLTIGQHAQLTSCLPRGLENKFEQFKNCLKWINAEGSMDGVSKIIARAEALFLSRHWTIKMISHFNITNLKYCLLAECNEMETLVETDGLFEDVETRTKNGDENALELLQYLSIHHMNKLKSLWKGPIGKDSLSKLRILALHTCSQFTSIFTPTIVQNLSCLVELTVEDCPKVISIISGESRIYGPIFPSLEKIFLLDLPKLVYIFDGQVTLKNLRTMLVYSCEQFMGLSYMELPHIEKIEGETEWWKGLGYEKSQRNIPFVALKERRDLVEQLFDATNSLEHFHNTPLIETKDKESYDPRNQEIISYIFAKKYTGMFFPPEETEEETEDDSSYGFRSEAPDTDTESDTISSLTEEDWFYLQIQGFENQVRYLKRKVLKDMADGDCSVVVVSGAAGCGKTTLVKQLCFDREIQEKFGRNIYFASISCTYDLKVIIKKLLEMYQLGKLPDFNGDEVAIQAWGSFLAENNSETLLVLDDVWSASVIKDFKFRSPGYKILVTSRITFEQFDTYHMERTSMALKLDDTVSELSREVQETHRLSVNNNSFKSKLKEMQETLESMRPVFEDMAKLNIELDLQKEETKGFINLLKEANDLVRKTKNFKWNFYKRYKHALKLDEMNRLLRKFVQFNLQFELARNVAEKVADVESLIKGFEDEKSSGWLAGVPLEKCVAIGFDDRVTELKALVLKDSPDGDCSVLIVSAVGGSGKTTLVTMLCHDPEIKGRFGRNIYFVTVSRIYDKKVIVQSLLGELPGITDDEAAILQWGSFLGKNNSELLLVLDDVWSEAIITDLKFKSPRYKILVTSRMIFTHFKTYELPALNFQDATRLFRASAFSELNNHIPDDLVAKLVKCCKFHPLALTVIGSMLRGTHLARWKLMLMQLSENKSLLDLSESIQNCLEKSMYLFDEEPELKQCFLDFGLFPEYQNIAATALMDMWAHLYNHDDEGLVTMNILKKLSSRNLASLFPRRKHLPAIANHCEEEYVAQYAVMRDLVIHLASQEPIEQRERLIINSYGQNLPQLPKTVNARMLSISTGESFDLTWNDIQVPKVEVFVLNFMSKIHPLPQLMQNMKRLKVLIITYYGYSFPMIQNFPAPQYLSGLTRIRLDHVSISSISTPILMLENLQKLSLIMCKIGNSFNQRTTSMLPSLLEIDIESCDDLVTFPAVLCNVVGLQKLSITNCHELTSLSEEFGKLSNLEVLRLASCSKLQILPYSIRELNNLRIIDLSHCLNLLELPQYIGELSSLQTIDVTGCTDLHGLPKSVKDFDRVKVVCDEEVSHLWNDFKNVKVEVVEEDILDAFRKIIPRGHNM